MVSNRWSCSYVFEQFQVNLKGDAEKETDSRSIPTFLTLYIFGLLYQLVLVYDALRLKNTIQIIGLCIYNIGLLIYAAVQMDQIQTAVVNLHAKGQIDLNIWITIKPFLVAIPCIIAIGTVFMSVVAWKLYDEFAWTIYKHISADLRMKRRYLTFQVCLPLKLQWATTDRIIIDLYCAPEIRLFLLPRLHNPIPRHSRQQKTNRILPDHCRNSRHNHNPSTGRPIHPQRKQTRHGHYHRKSHHPYKTLYNPLTDQPAAPLLRRPRLLPLQTRPHVPNRQPRPLPLLRPRPPLPHHLRRHHHHPNRPDNHQRVRVHGQFRSWPEAVYCGPEGRERGREVAWRDDDGDAEFGASCGHARDQSDDD